MVFPRTVLPNKQPWPPVPHHPRTLLHFIIPAHASFRLTTPILTTKKTMKIRSPDSRIYVYGSDKDCVESYDWGPQGRSPTAHFWDPTVSACGDRGTRGGYW